MKPWTKGDELRFAVAYALRQMRPLLRRIASHHVEVLADFKSAGSQRDLIQNVNRA